jgi:hypothetical protein
MVTCEEGWIGVHLKEIRLEAVINEDIAAHEFENPASCIEFALATPHHVYENLFHLMVDLCDLLLGGDGLGK